MTTIRIPTPLRPYTNSQAEVPVSGATVGDVLSDAEELIVVALHNLIEGVHVALLAGVDKRQVIEGRPNGIGGRIASGSYRLHGRASFLNRIRLNQLP